MKNLLIDQFLSVIELPLGFLEFRIRLSPGFVGFRPRFFDPGLSGLHGNRSGLFLRSKDNRWCQR